MDNYLSVKFLEQPASKGYRFRKTNQISWGITGQILGTYPTIQIAGPAGPKLLVIQLVSRSEPFRPHPFALIGEYCENGVYTQYVNEVFQDLKLDQIGIQFFTPDEFEKALEFRKIINMDPFGNGFSTSYLQTIDYFSVRLCVTVKIIKSGITKTIISEPIYDRISNSSYFRMRTGMRSIRPNTSTYNCPPLEIDMHLSEREVNVRSAERTDTNSLIDRSNNDHAALRIDRFQSIMIIRTNEFVDIIRRRNYYRQEIRNRASPLPMRRNLDRTNFSQSFPNSSSVSETLLYPITEIERINLVSDFNLLQINVQQEKPDEESPIGQQSNLSNMFNSMNLN